MKLFNTFSRKLEEVKPTKGNTISMYNCGPTVYWDMQLGNLRAYTFVDVLRRSLEYLGYDIKQVMNFTDVGHLSSDADEGEDKIEREAKRENKDPWQIAEHYIESVRSDFKEMNFLTPKTWVRATDHVQDMINLIQKMEENGFTYETERGVYFDVTQVPGYTRMAGGQELEDKKVTVREGQNVDPDKRHPADFALWVKAVGPQAGHIMRWESPWGVGFPGWHIECSAMGIKYLGTDIDVHTGGEDHIPVHHPNERAQNYGAFKKEVVKMWVHNAFLNVNGGRMGKSEGNAFTLKDVKDKGFDPMDLRFFFLGAQYRTKQNFTWEALKAAQTARKKLLNEMCGLESSSDFSPEGHVLEEYRARFVDALENDLVTPKALALIWDILKDEKANSSDKVVTILDFDKVLGLKLDESKVEEKELSLEVAKKVELLVERREAARTKKAWDEADKLRKEIEDLGAVVEDTPEGPVWRAA